MSKQIDADSQLISEVIERIKQLSDDHSSVRAFARHIGYNEASVRNYLAGREPKMSFCVHAAAAEGVSLDWLLTGQGERLAQPAAPTEPTGEDLDARLQNQQDLINFQRAKIDELKRQVHELESVRLTEDRGMPLGRRAHKAAEQKD